MTDWRFYYIICKCMNVECCVYESVSSCTHEYWANTRAHSLHEQKQSELYACLCPTIVIFFSYTLVSHLPAFAFYLCHLPESTRELFIFSLLSFVWHNPRLKYACVACARFAIYRVYRVSVILIFSMFFFLYGAAHDGISIALFGFFFSSFYWIILLLTAQFFFTSCDFTANKTAGGGATTAMMIAMIVLLNGRSCVSLTA